MIEKLKEKIDKNRNDKQIYKDYIKAFVDLEEAKNKFSDNSDFDDLIVEEVKDNKKEDEYF